MASPTRSPSGTAKTRTAAMNAVQALVFEPAAWTAFIAAVRGGELSGN
jgi:hypothetical protein